MKKLILPTLLVFVYFLILGSLFPIKAQESERSVTMMNFEGEDIQIWGDDDQSCTAIRGKHTECQAIADKCVENGGCAPQLVTLNFMGCEKCDAVAKPCFDSVEADYKKCIKAAVSKYKEEQSSTEPTDQQKTTPPVQDLKDDKGDKPLFKFPVFLNEWFNWVGEWIKLNTLEISLKESELREEQKEIEELKKKQEEARARLEALEADWERQARETFWKSVTEAKFVAGPGDQSEVYKQPAAEYKKGGNDEFEPLSDTQILNHGDVIQVTRRAIIRTPNYVIELYPKGIYEKAVVELRDGKLLLKNGAVTIWKGGWGQEFVGYQYVWEGMQTPVLDAVDVQTQYTVAHDEKENKSYVIVSEGEVKVTTKDGKTTLVSPNGDKPGVVVVSQRLSPIKLAIAGLVLAAVLGGVVLILKRKFTAKGSNKKKK